MSDHVNTHNIVLIWSLCVISVEQLLLYVERLLLSVIAIFYWQDNTFVWMLSSFQGPILRLFFNFSIALLLPVRAPLISIHGTGVPSG
jgi:hypothetical protein